AGDGRVRRERPARDQREVTADHLAGRLASDDELWVEAGHVEIAGVVQVELDVDRLSDADRARARSGRGAVHGDGAEAAVGDRRARAVVDHLHDDLRGREERFGRAAEVDVRGAAAQVVGGRRVGRAGRADDEVVEAVAVDVADGGDRGAELVAV